MPPTGMCLPLDHERLRATTLFTSPFAHPTVMFNRQHLDAAELRYSEAATYAEDYDLWERASTKTVLANIPEFLLYYLRHPKQMTALHGERQREVADGVRMRALRRLGIDPTPSEMALHSDCASGHDMDRSGGLNAAHAWLRKLEAAARRRGEPAIAAECAFRAKHLKMRITQNLKPMFSAAIGRFGRFLHAER